MAHGVFPLCCGTGRISDGAGPVKTKHLMMCLLIVSHNCHWVRLCWCCRTRSLWWGCCLDYANECTAWVISIANSKNPQSRVHALTHCVHNYSYAHTNNATDDSGATYYCTTCASRGTSVYVCMNPWRPLCFWHTDTYRIILLQSSRGCTASQMSFKSTY